MVTENPKGLVETALQSTVLEKKLHSGGHSVASWSLRKIHKVLFASFFSNLPLQMSQSQQSVRIYVYHMLIEQNVNAFWCDMLLSNVDSNCSASSSDLFEFDFNFS